MEVFGYTKYAFVLLFSHLNQTES